MKSVLITLLLFFMIDLYAQPQQGIKSVMWKLEAPKSGKTSYILGTFHVFGKNWLDKFPVLKEKIKASRLFFCETKNTSASNIYNYFDSSKGPEKIEHFFPGNVAKVDSFFASFLGMEEPFSSVIENVKDYAAQQIQVMSYGQLLSLQYRDVILGNVFSIDSEIDVFPIDLILEVFADSLGVAVDGLDDPEYIRKNVYADNTFEGSKDLLLLINNIIDKKNGAINRTVERDAKEYILYNSGLFDFSTAYNQKRKEIDWTTNVKRNRAWVKKMEDALTRNNCFIAVGVGHLFSNNKYGVLDILKRKGFKVSEVTLE